MEYFFSLFLGTFFLEDVALASALTLVSEDKITWPLAFMATSSGIAVGDIALYVLGFIVGKFRLEQRFRFLKKLKAKITTPESHRVLDYSIVFSRFIPGTRLPTYFVSGFVRYPFWRFFSLTVVTVLAWVALAFAVGHSLKSVLMANWLLSLVFLVIFFQVLRFFLTRLSGYWERRAFLHSWRKWMSFEFWPATLFYLPIIPYYIFLSLKHRSILAPFYANPSIENGGLIGESKWDFLKHLFQDSPFTLKTIKLAPQDDFQNARDLIFESGFSYPFILKPDIGQRGFGVRIIRDDFDLTEYLLLSDFQMVVQELSQFQNEAGIFYVRHPSHERGFVFSITDKKFPTVRGDGESRLGDLILKDPRARIIAPVYFERHRASLDNVLPPNEITHLSECGNHCQGAIFLNGNNLKTSVLEDVIDEVAKQIPHFYFGRFDVRYRDKQSLRLGKNFEIVEVNGAGSEATHIWDSRTRLFEAYRILFEQWSLLFSVGSEVRELNIGARISILGFLKESRRVFFRKEKLSISS